MLHISKRGLDDDVATELAATLIAAGPSVDAVAATQEVLLVRQLGLLDDLAAIRRRAARSPGEIPARRSAVLRRLCGMRPDEAAIFDPVDEATARAEADRCAASLREASVRVAEACDEDRCARRRLTAKSSRICAGTPRSSLGSHFVAVQPILLSGPPSWGGNARLTDCPSSVGRIRAVWSTSCARRFRRGRQCPWRRWPR
jgi:hypothetical protein